MSVNDYLRTLIYVYDAHKRIIYLFIYLSIYL